MAARVVHISTVHSPHDPRIYHKQCRTLAQAGFDVTLIIPAYDPDFQAKDGVRAVLLPPPANRRERLRATRRLAFIAARDLNADIYHFHDPELILLGRKLKKRDNIIVFDVHEDYETALGQKEYLPKFLAPLAAMAYRWLTKALTRRFELCLAEKYYREKLPRGKCILNYPLLSHRQAPAWEADNRDLLYTGNVTPERGAYIHAGLPALAEDLSLTFLGKCSQPVALGIAAAAGAAEDRVKVVGVQRHVPWEEIEDAYFSQRWLAGLALFPSSAHYKKKELTKFFEYMYAKIPILCSDFPAWREFVDKYDCGLAVNPQDSTAIAAALQQLMTDRLRRQEMGENGRRAVEDRLNWEGQGRELVDWYNHLLQRIGKESKKLGTLL